VADFLLRLEQEGEVLGEWRLGHAPLKISIVDPVTGRVVATVSAGMPDAPIQDRDSVIAADKETTMVSRSSLFGDGIDGDLAQIVGEPTAELPRPSNEPPFVAVGAAVPTEPPETDEMVNRPLTRRELHRIDPYRMDYSTTQSAPLIDMEDTISAPRLMPGADGPSVTSMMSGSLSEPTESLPELGLDLSGEPPELTLDPPSQTGSEHLDELPVGSDDPGPLARHPGDDFTLPLPVSENTATGTGEESTGQLGDSLTGELVELECRAEVWSRRGGEWVLKGTLVPGQRARMKEGSVKCLPDGGLMVTPGSVMRATADTPGGEKIQMMPGESAKRFPAGTAVTLWTGERALYVRSDQPMADVAPVEYHPGRSQSVAGYQPPKSDLESTGHGEL
jgi:hypothetical protein